MPEKTYGVAIIGSGIGGSTLACVLARQGLSVVPVALAGTCAVLSDGSWQPRPGPLAVTICAPHQPAGEDWHDLLALRDQEVAQAARLWPGHHDVDRLAGGGLEGVLDLP